jgi:hypothetical protein
MIWLKPNSSIAMDAKIRLTASSREIEGLIVGKLGWDIK